MKNYGRLAWLKVSSTLQGILEPQVCPAASLNKYHRGFSNNEPVESIETEKSRIILHELEKGWWVLAVRSRTQTSCQ
jgi:hypothetical protein